VHHADTSAALLDAPWQADPYALYARLRAQHPDGVFRDPASQLWVACTAAAVQAALHDPALRVRPPAEPVPLAFAGTPAGTLFGGLMRQNEGEVHRAGKAWALEALGREMPVDAAVRSLVGQGITPRLAPLNELMFEAPVRVLWRLLNGDEDAGALPAQVRAIATGWSLLADDAQRAAASTAAAALLERCGNQANRIGLYTQTCEATAGLIGNVLIAFQREAGLRERWLKDAALDQTLACEVARHDAPTHNTRRFVAQATTIGGHALQPGEVLLLLLASANRDTTALPDADRFVLREPPAPVFTWGTGAHHCPGAALSRAIAMALLRGWFADCPDLAARTTQWSYHPSPNGRLPRFGSADRGATR
jgi:cytochrome P450